MRGKLFIAAVLAIILILLYLSVTFYSFFRPPTTSQSQTNSKNQTVRNAPKVYFDTYLNKTSLPSIPPNLSTYQLKTAFSSTEVLQFAQKLGLNKQYSTSTVYDIVYNIDDPQKKGYLLFNKNTGSFSFRSFGVVKASGNQNPRNTALNFLQSLGISDPTLSCPITYQRNRMEGVTFVECHRDWNKIGLPILNLAGLLNLPASIKLTEVNLSTVEPLAPEDPTISSLTFVQNGISSNLPKPYKSRPTDFNTITVAVTDGGRIFSVESSLKWIDKSGQVTRENLATPTEALQKFYSHLSILSLTLPAGSGTVDWDKVYQNNLAEAKQAVITDYILAYLEKGGETVGGHLVPMYLIRGQAQLNSGYTVSFVETVPALKNGLSFLSYSDQKAVAGVSKLAQNSEDPVINLKQLIPPETPRPATYPTPTPTPRLPSTTSPTPTPTPTTVIPTPPPGRPTPTTSTRCTGVSSDGDSTSTTTIQIPGTGNLEVIQGHSGLPSSWFYTLFLKSSSLPIKDIETVRGFFFDAVEEQYVINVAKILSTTPNFLSPTPTTVNDVYDIFTRILLSANQRSDSLTSLQTSVFAGSRRPPLPGWRTSGGFSETSLTGASVPFDIANMKVVVENVAARTLEIIRDNKISQWASKPDLFPADINNEKFDWTFYNSSDYFQSVGIDTDCYISGLSPSLFLYPEIPSNIGVSLLSPLTYTFPPTNNTWKVLASPDGKITLSNLPAPINYLYYEYDKTLTTFTQPEESFMTQRENWESTAKSIARQLELNSTETAQFINEIKNSLLDLPPSPYLKLSLLKKDEINKNLPLNITPAPDNFYRIHILVAPALYPDPSIKRPNLIPLKRSGFTVVEIGAVIL
ncbi:hypothetical protein HY384_02815 [Candidatus Daviesbacteria bacterium]|nr:hypothetical protein [Candidatus Daviesbacteria bacterium]